MKAILVLAALLLATVPTATAAGSDAGAEIHVYPTAVDVAEAPRFVLVNTGEVVLAYGTTYKLERWTTGGWHWINKRQAWRLPLLGLPPGKTSRPERIGIWKPNPEFERCPRSEPCCIRVVLRPGLYRVTKSFSTAAGVLTAHGTFRVLDKPTGTAE